MRREHIDPDCQEKLHNFQDWVVFKVSLHSALRFDFTPLTNENLVISFNFK